MKREEFFQKNLSFGNRSSLRVSDLLKSVLIFFAYFITAKLGLKMDAVSGFATLVWPPTGIALAVLLLYGFRFWPVIFLSAFLINCIVGAPLISALGIAAGNALEALVAAYVLLRFAGFRNSIDRIKDVAALVIFAVFLSTLVSATLGTFSLWLGNVQTEGLGVTWLAWWSGDLLGDLIVAPLILVWGTWIGSGVHSKIRQNFNLWRYLEAILFFVSSSAVSLFLFSSISSELGMAVPTLPYILFPFIVWAALRFEQLGNVLVVFAISAAAVWGTSRGFGPFSHGTLRENLFLLNSFIGVLALTGMTLAASVAERRQAIEDRRKAEEAERFLIGASDILTDTLNYETRLSRLVRLTLPGLADWCVIDVIERDGVLKRVAAAHYDPAKEEFLNELQKNYPPTKDSPQPTGEVLRTGKAVLLTDMNDEVIRAYCFNEEHADLMKKIGVKSHLSVPLVFHGNITGVLALGRGERESFSASEVMLVERLAKRAALAIDNARLYVSAETERAKLKALFLQAPAIINIQRGPEHIFDLVHPLTKELLGGRDVTGMTAREAMPELEGQGFFDKLDSVYVTGESFHGKEIVSRLRMPDGKIKETFWNFVYQPWYEADGKIGGVMTFAVDVSDQVLARKKIESLARSSEILSTSLDYETTLSKIAELTVPEWADWCSIDILDDEKNLKSIVLAHKDPQKIKFAKEVAIRYPTNVNSLSGAPKVIRTGKSVFYPEISSDLLRKNAQDLFHAKLLMELGINSLIIVPLSSQGKTLGALTLVSAESGRKFTADDLAFAEELGRRAGVAVENSRLYLDVQRAVQIRDDFLSIASHELRTPLTSLYLELQLIERMISKSQTNPLSVEKLMARIVLSEKQTRKLSRLIDDLLDVSRLGRGKLTIEKEYLDISETTTDIVSAFKEEAKRTGSQLTSHIPDRIMGDFDKLRITQAVTNLISNALKYGEGRPIDVFLKPMDKKIQIIVQDHGLGIAQKDQVRIFGRFERAVSHHSISGLGLGLYITKQIAEAHGGMVLVKSEPNKGSTFSLELPLTSEHKIKAKFDGKINLEKAPDETRQ